MGKIKNLFSNISNSMKETFKKFPITMMIVYITTLICAFGTEDFVEKFFDDMWFYMMGVWAIGTFFSEKMFKNNLVKILGQICSFIIALTFRWILFNENYENNINLIKLIVTYMSVIPLITIYKILKDSELSVKEYAIRVLGNIGKATTIYLLANLGILIVILVFIELILDGNDYEILPRTLILLCGGFYVPAIVNSIIDVKNETGKLMKILLTGILMPVALFLIGTLYLYITKIMISGEILNKALFFILSLTFSLAIPGVILLRNYDNSKAVLIISNILFYSFIPLLILQIISMNVRVSEYGLTESRYMGYLLIAFEIIFIALIIIKNSKYLDKIILVFAGFIIVGLLSPFNIVDVPIYSQTARITDMLETVESFEDLSVGEKDECKKAFRYVEKSYKPEYLDEKLSKEEKETIQNYVIQYTDNSDVHLRDYDYEYISIYDRKSEVNIEGFKMLYHSYEYSYDEKKDINNYEITDKDEKIKVTVDLENFIREMYKAQKGKNKNEIFEKIRLLETSDENVMFYVTEFSLSYEMYKNNLESISIEGYILVK